MLLNNAKPQLIVCSECNRHAHIKVGEFVSTEFSDKEIAQKYVLTAMVNKNVMDFLQSAQMREEILAWEIQDSALQIIDQSTINLACHEVVRLRDVGEITLEEWNDEDRHSLIMQIVEGINEIRSQAAAKEVEDAVLEEEFIF